MSETPAGEHSAEADAPLRTPRPCPTCGRMGSCADCCCVHPAHHRRWPGPSECPLCQHATRVTASAETAEGSTP